MQQHFDAYTTEDHLVWQTLFNRQRANLEHKAHPRYLACLEAAKAVLHSNHIPKFDLLSDALLKATGWQIEVVPGLIPTVAFLQLLKEKKFPSSTWLRSMAQLDYLEEPDMFHDIFGHVPLLFDPEYANLMQAIGELGIRHQSNPSVIDAIERFYWYTIEFGLSKHNENMRIFGAGILSSFGETNAIFSPTAPPIDAYNLNDILTRPFRKDEMQTRYFLLPQLETLYEQEQILQQSFQVQPLH